MKNAGKRETGLKPVRSRHCIQQCIANYVTEKSGRRRYALRCEPGNLPAVVREFVEFQITRFDRTETYIFLFDFDDPAALCKLDFFFSVFLNRFSCQMLKKRRGKENEKETCSPAVHICHGFCPRSVRKQQRIR